MRKFKIYSSIALISGLLLALASVLVPIIKLSNYTAQNGSIRQGTVLCLVFNNLLDFRTDC